MAAGQVAYIPLTSGKTLPTVLVRSSIKHDPHRRTEALREFSDLFGQPVALLTDDYRTWITNGPNEQRIVRRVSPRLLRWRRFTF